MKKLFSLICFCIAGAFLASAQEREALEDSVIIGSIPRSVVDMLFTEGQTDEEKLVIHWAYAEFLKDVSREHLVLFSDQELRDILAYFRSDAYRYIMSSTFLNLYVNNILSALQYELGAKPEFSYDLNDRSYGSGWDSALQAALTSMLPVINEMLGDDGKLMAEARNSGVSDAQIKQLSKAVKNVISNVPALLKLSFVDYLGNEALEEMIRFYNSVSGQKYSIYSQKIKNAADQLADSYFEQKISAWADEDKSYGLKKSIADYVSLSRAFPEYFPELYRPYAELDIAKGRYAGQTRDLLPHGKGKLVDKKGVVYEGDFRNGKRHGQITVTKPGKEPQVEFWYDDRYMKGILAEASADGTVYPVQVISGNRNGYGNVNDSARGIAYQGLFVDGELNGPGEVSEPARYAKGEFVNGSLVNGLMAWAHEDYKVNQFQGRIYGDLRSGIRDWVSHDGRRKERQMGLFVDGSLDGKGFRTVYDVGRSLENSGVFANGKLYGSGTQRSRTVYQDNGISLYTDYVGEFFADQFHGYGCLSLTYTDIPEGNWTFTFCEVKLPSFNGDSLVVKMEGNFDSGAFKKGKVSYSDGSWYEGVFGRAGLMEGKMYRKYSDGSYYVGECLDGKYHGDGEVHYTDGTSYIGKFEYGSPVGDVTNLLTSAMNQAEYKADMAYDNQVTTRSYKFEDLPVEKGKVRLVKAAGVKIMVRNVSSLEVTCEGHFDNETFDFLDGKVTMSDGNWMEGTFEDGVLILGKARNVDKYGTIYEGDIKNGYPHGNGKCIYADGTWFKGKFANGNRMGGTHYTADGKVIKVYK